MKLREIYQPIEKDLNKVEQVLKGSLQDTRYESVLKVNNYLLDAGGKRLRPALVLLSAGASRQQHSSDLNLINIASAIELIHMASLIHDDVIDHSRLRHKKPTINSKWGLDVSITLGDYLLSVAFELISKYGNLDIIQCISQATKTMCEGELLQVCERDNLELLKEKYIVIVRKKTASLFAASCQVGGLISKTPEDRQSALKEFGLNFGTAFQIVDDYLDLVGEKKKLGKIPGQDISVGEMTLPLLNLFESASQRERQELATLLSAGGDEKSLKRIRTKLFNSNAGLKTKDALLTYVALAKDKLEVFSDSEYKESLLKLTDSIVERGFNDKS